MSEIEKQPADPFANLNLDEFKQKKEESNERVSVIDKEVMRKAAEQSNFGSRQGVPKKQKLVTKTFSLFQQEIAIINNAIRAYLEFSGDEDLSSPSNSDAVRAGLHLLAEKSPEQQGQLIAEHRGRGRK